MDGYGLQQLLGSSEEVLRWIFQLEKCPQTDRLHYQGFVMFKKSMRFVAVKRFFNDNEIHIEKALGGPHANRAYCSKEESRVEGPWEGGEWKSKQGERRDIDSIKELLDDGADEKTIADTHFGTWVRYHKAFRVYSNLGVGIRDWKTRLEIHWGRPGTGKTKYVYDKFGFGNVYDVPRPNGGCVWFDGLADSAVCLLDDFYGWVPLHLLLKLADRYPLKLPTKGGFTQFVCTHLIITSNQPWTDWYRWDELGHGLRGAFERRIDLIKEY